MGHKPRIRPGRETTGDPVAMIRAAALALPETFEQPSYDGQPSWRTKPRMFAWVRTDPEALVVWVPSLDDKEAMLASEPALFFTTPHYNGLPIVLVRLERLSAPRAESLLLTSYRVRAPRSLARLI